MGVWRDFGMVSSSVKDVFFIFLTSATSSENDASKLTGQGWQPQDWDWVAEIWCFSTRPGCLDGLDVAGASWRCWKATWIC